MQSPGSGFWQKPDPHPCRIHITTWEKMQTQTFSVGTIHLCFCTLWPLLGGGFAVLLLQHSPSPTPSAISLLLSPALSLDREVTHRGEGSLTGHWPQWYLVPARVGHAIYVLDLDNFRVCRDEDPVFAKTRIRIPLTQTKGDFLKSIEWIYVIKFLPPSLLFFILLVSEISCKP